MESFLIVQRGDEIGRRVDLQADQVTIGRGSDNDVTLNDPMVSRYHAVLKRQGDQYGVIDLGSSNPVVVNDQGLEPGIARQLAHRDVILIGRNVFSFQQRSGGVVAAQPGTPVPRPATTPPTRAAIAPSPAEPDTNAADRDRTVLSPQQGRGEGDKTMIDGRLESQAPPTVQFDDETPTNVGMATPQGDRMSGAPPSGGAGDLPTQIIPRR